MADKDPGKWVPLRHYLRLKRGRYQELALG
ncbi:MAG: hypothetical protein JWO59_3546, partial [Chloroflexi bacterium]|nr:hypothetical protein [Chloroflexota bacterium]